MADTLKLPEPEELKGVWTIVEAGKDRRCALTFDDEPAPGGYALQTSDNCLHGMDLSAAAAWRPAPDGVVLTSPDGRAVAFFSRTGERAYAAERGGRTLHLSRG